MSERKHGRRYSFKEKKDILDFLENHTYKDTSEKFNISETTLSRWRNEIKSGSKYNKTKIIISLPKFWLEYLNEQIEADVWEDYSDAVLTIIRDYVKLAKDADSNYLKRAKEILPTLVNLNSNIESMLVSSSNEVIYKTEKWESAEEILDLIKIWKESARWHQNRRNKWKNTFTFPKLDPENRNIRSFEFQKETYSVRDISVKHLIAVKRGIPPSSQLPCYLLMLRRKLTEMDVYIFAIAKQMEQSSLLSAMDTLKRAAMGSLPPSTESTVEKSSPTPKDMPSSELKTILKRFKKNKNYRKESRANWEKEKEKKFKMGGVLMRVATRVNIPLEPEEKKVLEALEIQIGKKIERITADPEQKISRNDLMPYQKGKLFQGSYQKLPWMHANVNFPAYLFPCHYIASNGKIILLTLLNFGLSEIPSEILDLKSLTYLNFNSNNISELPKTFSNAKSLENLFLNNNQFIKVPDILIELPKLQNLYMRNNQISKIPIILTEAWQARIGDPNFPPGNLIFSGNPIDRSSLSQEQLELEQKSLLNMHRNLYFVID